MRFLISLMVAHYVVVSIHQQCACHAVARITAWLVPQGGFRSRQICRICKRFNSLSVPDHGQRKLSTLVTSKCLDEHKLPDHQDSVPVAFDALKFWLIDNGATLDLQGLSLKAAAKSDQDAPAPSMDEAAGNWGLVATRRYRRGDLIASIPSNLQFTQAVLDKLIYHAFGGKPQGCGSSYTTEATAEPRPVNVRDPSLHLAFPLALFKVLQKEGWARRPPDQQAGQKGALLDRLYDGWLAYLRVLRPPPRSIPIFWSAAEVRALDHPIASAVFERLHRLQNSFPDFEATVRKHTSVPAWGSHNSNSRVLFGELMSAYATVLSRSIRVPGGQRAFVPLADLCRHSPHDGNANLKVSHPSQNYDVQTEPHEPLEGTSPTVLRGKSNANQSRRCVDGSIQLTTTSDIAPGDDIRISYGPFDNPTLLLNYGLLPQRNPHEKVQIEFSPRRVHFALRSIGVDLMKLADDFGFLGPSTAKELTRLGLAPPSANCATTEGSCVEYRPTVTVNRNSECDARLLAAAKVLAATSDYTTSFDEGQGLNGANAPQSLDEKAKRFIISFLQHALFENFSTTAAEDCKILRDRKVLTGRSRCGLDREATLSPGMRMAVTFRSTRRELLRKAISQLQESIKAK